MLKHTVATAGLALLVACGDSADRERPASDVPYGELEIAREVEVSPPPEATRPAEPRRRPAPAPSSAQADVPDTVEVPDTAGYAPYPDAEHTPDTVPSEPADPVVAAADTAKAPVAAPAPAPRADSQPSPERPAPAEPAAPVESSPPAPAASAGRTVAAGTVIHAVLEDSIHSRQDVSGKEVAAKVMENVRGPDGLTLIPAGTPLWLTVTQVKPGRGGRKGVLEIRTDSITISGEPRKLEARLEPVSHELRGRGVTGDEAAKVGVGAAGGAVVGRVLGGNTKGAVIGGVVGAAGGAVVASETAAKDVVVKARTPVALVLTAPLPADR